MSNVLHGWPYVGLLLALALLGWLLMEARTPGSASRWRDPAFVLALLWPMYLVHQFEEHGIDLEGQRFAFLEGLCATLGHPDVASCPGDPAFIFVVNVVACTVSFVMPLIWRRSRPLVAAFGWGIVLANALVHIGAAVVARAYNPGLATSLLLFLPLSVWMLRVMLRADVIAPRHVALIFLAGVLMHAVLVGSLIAREQGLIGHVSLLVINGLNGLVPLTIGLAVGSRVPPPRAGSQPQFDA